MNPSPRRSPLGFRIIAAYKLVTAVLSLALGFGLFRLFRADASANLELAIPGSASTPKRTHSRGDRAAGGGRPQAA